MMTREKAKMKAAQKMARATMRPTDLKIGGRNANEAVNAIRKIEAK